LALAAVVTDRLVGQRVGQGDVENSGDSSARLAEM
jgi:hypothetical protein